jgi:hypothetical protein
LRAPKNLARDRSMQPSCFHFSDNRESQKVVTPITTVYPERFLLNHFSGDDFVFQSHITDNQHISKIRNYFISLAAV